MIASVYRQREYQNSPYYRCVEDHFEAFEHVYKERFERRYGFFRSYVKQVIYRYLGCVVLKNGLARVRCEDCGHEYLLAFSCKRRHFCPSCNQKCVVEFGEWLCQEVVKSVPHRYVVFSIPKILRRYFLYDRKLLSDLSRCGWEALKTFYTTTVRDPKAVSGAVVAIQTFGDFLGFHPHLHILVSDGCFFKNGMFSVSPAVEIKALEEIFRHKVLRMLLSKGKKETSAWSGLLQCVLMCPTRAIRWFGIMAFTAMWRRENGKKPISTTRSPVFWIRRIT